MKATRITAVLVLVASGLAAAACWHLHSLDIYAMFQDFGSPIPPPLTKLAALLYAPASLAPLAILSAILVILAELKFKSERSRFISQILVLIFWLLIASLVAVAFWIPLTRMGTTVSGG